MTSQSLFFVFANPAEGQEAEFNTWYDQVHLQEVVAVPGITGAQRYVLTPHETPANDVGEVAAPPHRYLAAYDVEGEPDQVMADFLARMGSGQMTLSPALDFASVSMGFWTAHGPRVTPS